MKRSIYKIFGVVALSGLTWSCSFDRSPDSKNYDPNNPGFEYQVEGDMYHSFAYDGWSQHSKASNHYNKDSSNQWAPVSGTVARGKSLFAMYDMKFADWGEGYKTAGATLNYPADMFKSEKEALELGKKAYEVHCWHCHGKEGGNDGPLFSSGKYPKPATFANYQSDYIKNLPYGNMYFTITYGKNAMGAHGSHLNVQERWAVSRYVKELSKKTVEGAEAGAAAEGAAAPAPTETAPAAPAPAASK